jgi:hypothetical protein
MNDCLSGFFRAEACPLPKAAVLSRSSSSAASAPCHAHAHPHHHSNNHIHHDHQPRADQTNLPLCETGPVSHGITGDRIRSARQGRDLGDGAGNTCREKDTKKTGTIQACGSSSLPHTNPQTVLLSQTETAELKRKALFLATVRLPCAFGCPNTKDSELSLYITCSSSVYYHPCLH